jgi:S-adenosylmethionine:tRNA ribosyltransferase-isomerase
MNLSEFEFPLPEDLIALEPAPERGGSRLLVLGPDGPPEHRMFTDLPEYLRPGDLLVLNDTRVTPCRVPVVRGRGGAMLEVLLVRPRPDGRWDVMSKGGYSGPAATPCGRIRMKLDHGMVAELEHHGPLSDALDASGLMPLPPYIKRQPDERDRAWYQTVYARQEGSIAAPTAGLHFTAPMLAGLLDAGVLVRFLTLHVGSGTFKPVRAERVADHRMDHEEFLVPRALLDEIASVRSMGSGRVVAVGTTTTRALEAIATGRFLPTGGSDDASVAGSTDIFIAPGYRFRAVDALVTNFHLPRSTPLMLASALAGQKRLLAAYASAVERSYGFFSYGDAMLIF